MGYENGKIYRLVCNVTGLQYYGSTKSTLADRKYWHKADYRKWQNGKGNYITAFMVMENDNYDMVLVENYPCKDRNELRARERHYIENFKCVNKNIPSRTPKEYNKDNKERIAKKIGEWYIKNKDKVKMYHQLNKEKVNESTRKYREKNKDTLNEKKREKLICVCGASVTRTGKARHEKRKKHLNYINQCQS